MWCFLWILWIVVNGKTNVCPGGENQCSLHGTCVKDKQGQFLCSCEWGYTNNDCSKRLCPHGYDPLQEQKHYRKIRLTFTSKEELLEGKLHLSFHRHFVEAEANSFKMTSAECTKVFQRFQTFDDISCERVSTDSLNGGVYDITIKSFPVQPIMNNLFYHNGNPSIKEFACDTQYVAMDQDKVECYFTDLINTNIYEYKSCSNHGSCNENTGQCICDEGYYGDNCDSNKDDKDMVIGHSNGVFFTGNVAKLSAKRGKSHEYNFVHAQAGDIPVLTVTGEGHTILHEGDLNIKKGTHVIEHGGLDVRGGIQLHQSNFQLHDGTMEITSSNESAHVLHLRSVGSEIGKAVLSIEGTMNTNHAYNILHLQTNQDTIFEIDYSGKTHLHKGGLHISGKDGIRLEQSHIHVEQGDVHLAKGNVLAQEGRLEIGTGAIGIGSGDLTMNDGTALIQSSSNKAILSISSTNTEFQNSMFTIQSASTLPYPMFQTKVNGVLGFEISSTGEAAVHNGGLAIKAGGLIVESGGQQIHSGGLKVLSGGIQIESGGLTIQNEGFKIDNGGLKVINTVNGAPVLQVHATNPTFSGSAFTIDCASTISDAVLIEAKSQTDQVFSVDNQGRVYAKGSIRTASSIIAEETIQTTSGMILKPKEVEAGETIFIPCDSSHIVIVDDGKVSANEAIIDTANAIIGQILMIHNKDDQALQGPNTPSHSVSMFLFDGSLWECISSKASETTEATIIPGFQFLNEVANFGESKVVAKEVQVAGQKAAQVAIYGTAGILSGNEKLTFVEDVLSVPILRVDEIKGRVNLEKSEFAHAHIIEGDITNVKIDARSIICQGEMHVGSDSFIGGGLTVSGQVMGSGAYMDTSDKRFKVNITQLSNASNIITNLRGVQYHYRQDMFPEYQFSDALQYGFIADEVEAVLPHLVGTNKDGYKHLAYNRIVPILVEAMKEQEQKHSSATEALQRQVEEQANRILKLENELKETTALFKMLICNSAIQTPLLSAMCP